jgi:hypothetical protein
VLRRSPWTRSSTRCASRIWEERIEELKDRVRRQYTREALARDSLSHGVPGSRASIHFESALSRIFVVTGVHLALDGAVQYAKDDASGALGGPSGIPVFNGSLPPGDHVVQVVVDLRGSGMGLFSYLREYHFRLRSTHVFTAIEGKTIDLDVSAGEKGNPTTPFEERPTVRYIEKVVDQVAR